jgi:hypothetical protein
MLEPLLKNISAILKKNEKFFQENPEIFLAIKERFYKAIEDEDEYQSDYDPYSDLFDEKESTGQGEGDEDYGYDVESTKDPKYQSIDDEDTPSGEQGDEDQSYEEPSYDPFAEDQDAEQERVLAELEQKSKQKPAQPAKATKPSSKDEDMYSEAGSDIKTPEQYKKEAEKEKPTSKRSQWQPKEKYAEHHQAAMKTFMDQGYSHRESEMLADAHDKLSMDQILKRGTKPSEPSPKMLEALKAHVGEIYGENKSKMSMMLDPSQNPDLHLNAHKNAIVKQANLPYKDAALAYRKNLAEQGKSEDEIDDMIPSFKKKWHSENEQHAQGLHNAAHKVSQMANENQGARKQRVEDVKHSLILATKGAGEEQSSPIVGDVSGMAGGASNKEAIRQAAGGFKGAEEEPTQIGTAVDPAYRVATKNPQYVQHLEQKVVQKLAPEQMERYNAIKGIKKGGQ